LGDDNRNILCKLWGISFTEANTWLDSAVVSWKQKDAIILVMISGVLKLIGPNGQRRMLEIMDRLSLASSVKSPGEGFPLTLIMVKLLFGNPYVGINISKTC